MDNSVIVELMINSGKDNEMQNLNCMFCIRCIWISLDHSGL